MKNKKFQDLFQSYAERKENDLSQYVRKEPEQKIDFTQGFDFSAFSYLSMEEKRNYLSDSLFVPLPLLQEKTLTPSAILIYSSILEEVGESNTESFQTEFEYLQQRLNMSRASISRGLALLTEQNFIRKEKIPYQEIPSFATMALYPLKDYSQSNSSPKGIKVCNGLLYNSQFTYSLIFLYSYIYSKSSAPFVKGKKNGYCDFSIIKEFKNIGISEKSCVRYMAQLNDMGLIEIYKLPKHPSKVKALVDFHKFFLDYKFKD